MKVIAGSITLICISSSILCCGHRTRDGIDGKLVWAGKSDSPIERMLIEKKLIDSNSREFRLTENSHRLRIREDQRAASPEVFNRKSNLWVTVHDWNENYQDTEHIKKQLIYAGNCDAVPVEIKVTESTPSGTIYIDDKPLGQIDDNGVFSDISKGYCKFTSITVALRKPDCEPWQKTVQLTNNPEKIIKKGELRCKN